MPSMYKGGRNSRLITGSDTKFEVVVLDPPMHVCNQLDLNDVPIDPKPTKGKQTYTMFDTVGQNDTVTVGALVDTKPIETTDLDDVSVDPKPTKGKPTYTMLESVSLESKPVEAKAVNSKPAEAKPKAVEAKPKPAEAKVVKPKPVEAKPKPVEAKPKPVEAKAVKPKPVEANDVSSVSEAEIKELLHTTKSKKPEMKADLKASVAESVAKQTHVIVKEAVKGTPELLAKTEIQARKMDEAVVVLKSKEKELAEKKVVVKHAEKQVEAAQKMLSHAHKKEIELKKKVESGLAAVDTKLAAEKDTKKAAQIVTEKKKSLVVAEVDVDAIVADKKQAQTKYAEAADVTQKTIEKVSKIDDKKLAKTLQPVVSTMVKTCDFMHDFEVLGALKKMPVDDEYKCVGFTSFQENDETKFGAVKCKPMFGMCPTKIDMNVCEVVPVQMHDLPLDNIKNLFK